MNQLPNAATAGESAVPSLRFDIVAGLTAAAVVLPKAMAYATVAGLPVAVGLYTAFVPMVIYALLGTSRVLSVSSTTTLAILAGTQLGLAVLDGDPAQLMEGERRWTDAGTVVWLAGMNPGVLEVARRAGLEQRLGRERMLFNARAAIERYQALQAEGTIRSSSSAT